MGKIPFKRVIAGILFILFWTGVYLAHHRPLSVGEWASLVPLRCPLSWIFKIQCPTCGLGRSLVAAALGHGQESWHYHPLGLPLFWSTQAWFLFWLVWPRASAAFWQRNLTLARRSQPALWLVIIVYSLWGFCWRAPI